MKSNACQTQQHIIYIFTGSCKKKKKMLREVPCTLQPVSSSDNILYNHRKISKLRVFSFLGALDDGYSGS